MVPPEATTVPVAPVVDAQTRALAAPDSARAAPVRAVGALAELVARAPVGLVAAVPAAVVEGPAGIVRALAAVGPVGLAHVVALVGRGLRVVTEVRRTGVTDRGPVGLEADREVVGLTATGIGTRRATTIGGDMPVRAGMTRLSGSRSVGSCPDVGSATTEMTVVEELVVTTGPADIGAMIALEQGEEVPSGTWGVDGVPWHSATAAELVGLDAER